MKLQYKNGRHISADFFSVIASARVYHFLLITRASHIYFVYTHTSKNNTR